jgi:hypothetical protein
MRFCDRIKNHVEREVKPEIDEIIKKKSAMRPKRKADLI